MQKSSMILWPARSTVHCFCRIPTPEGASTQNYPGPLINVIVLHSNFLVLLKYPFKVKTQKPLFSFQCASSQTCWLLQPMSVFLLQSGYHTLVLKAIKNHAGTNPRLDR